MWTGAWREAPLKLLASSWKLSTLRQRTGRGEPLGDAAPRRKVLMTCYVGARTGPKARNSLKKAKE